MVADALHNVPHHFRVEETERQPHQLREEIRNQRDVDPRVHMQQDPAPDEVHRQPRHEDHQLCNQYQRDESQIPIPNARVHQRLRQERRDQLQDAHRQHPQHQLEQFPPVRDEVAEKERQPLPFPLSTLHLFLAVVKIGPRLEQQGGPRILSLRHRAAPATRQLRFRVDQLLGCRVGNVILPLLYLIQDHEMVLVPVQDAGQRHLLAQLLQRHLHPHRPKANPFPRVADAQHRHPFARNERLFTQVPDRVATPVVLRNHPKTGGAAIGGFELVVERKCLQHNFHLLCC